MTDRQKFWLKVVLTVTFPLWVVPFAIAVLVFGFGFCIWSAISDMVDPPEGMGPGR